jgi:proteic killer suppression protein
VQDGLVDIVFRTKKLEKLCNDAKKRQKELGADRARRLGRRLDDLRAADNLEYRLIFEPAEDPPPAKPDGGLDWSSVRAIRINGIEDTHD